MKKNSIPISEYKIVISKNADDFIKYVASELKKYIAKGTDAILEVVDDSAVKIQTEIVLGNTNRLTKKLKNEEYFLKVQESTLFILGEGRGLAYGVYSFLEKLGYRFLAPNVDYIPPKEDVFIPLKLSERYVPDFFYREVMDSLCWNAEFSLKQKINGTFERDLSKYGGGVGYVNGHDGLVHTFKHLIPPAKYYNAHPEYFSLKDGKRTSDAVNCQLCLTNTFMIDELIKNALEWLRSETNPQMIHISQNDDAHVCECDKCKQSDEKFNHSGTLLNVVNAVARAVKKEFPNVMVVTLAYDKSLVAPKGVKPDDNVAVQFCTIGCCRAHALKENCKGALFTYDGQPYNSREILKIFDDWRSVADKIIVWDYVANYYRLTAPFPNIKVLAKNMRTFSEYNAVGVYSELVGYTTGEFQELKCYLLAKLSYKPKMTEQEFERRMTEFLMLYYGNGYRYIKKYIDETSALSASTHLANTSDMDKYLPIAFDEKTQKYDLTLINRLNGYFTKAIKVATREQAERLQKSQTQIEYLELYLTMDKRYEYASAHEKKALEKRCKDLYEKMQKFGITRKVGNEDFHFPISDFTKSPRYW